MKLAACLSLALLAASPAWAGPASDGAGATAGEWVNPKHTVRLRAQDCGTNLCGVIVWAAPQAEAQAARNHQPHLAGTELLRDFHQVSDKVWRGSVYVPDVHRTFAGTITMTDANTMIGKGCVLFGMICRSQTWTRIR